MNTIEKLHAIEEARCIYNIHYCKAGIGFCFYVNQKDVDGSDHSWKKNLETDRYYPTFEEAVDAEFERLV